MTAPNMAAITASLERSLQNCSLNHHRQHHHDSRGVLGGRGGEGSSTSSDDADAAEQNHHHHHHHHHQHHPHHLPSDDTSLELNSHLSLPYHWEQCLDLKTGEIYYINWSNGMKANEDPRIAQENNGEGDFYSEDDSSYDSEESSSESYPSSSREHNHNNYGVDQKEDHVLVVAGCKSCLMYFMVPKQVEDCPKCSGQLMHFDRSENGSA